MLLATIVDDDTKYAAECVGEVTIYFEIVLNKSEMKTLTHFGDRQGCQFILTAKAEEKSERL